LKRRHERAVGERFAVALGRQYGRQWTFVSQADAPDLTYRDQAGLVGVEVVSPYYDDDEAKARWAAARGEQIRGWGGLIDLPSKIADLVQKKCQRLYGSRVVLAIDFWSPLSTEPEIDDLVRTLDLPQSGPFDEIWLGVDLPVSLTRPSAHEGQYRLWRLYQRDVR